MGTNQPKLRPRGPLRLQLHAPATPQHCGVTFRVRFSAKQAANLRRLATALDMEEGEFIRAFLCDELPSPADHHDGDLAALAAREPLTVLCGNRDKEVDFQARLERAARHEGLPSVEEYVSQRLHLALWSDERAMVVHPRTGAVVGTEREWSELRRLLHTEPVQRFEADPLDHPGFLDRFPARNPMRHGGSLGVLDDARLVPGPVRLKEAA